ncbi:MAG: glycosyltransferase family 1 protein [Janthinobacterium lividum]
MASSYDLICFSHLRWDFVYQRPQHLMERFGREHRVLFVEEPVFDSPEPRLEATPRSQKNVTVLVAHLPWGPTEEQHGEMYQALLQTYMQEHQIDDYVLWYYTPMMASWTSDLTPKATVYDCMDELSAFADAPPALREREAMLFDRANLVFTGGQTLYEAKQGRHPAVYAFPSSVDVPFFMQARTIAEEPPDQVNISHPRLGFYGVVDERLDVALLGAVAALRPQWQWIIVGPTVSKIDPTTLPQLPNIHYLGGKSYAELPAYLAGWDVALLPFARNESTRFISPTKTPEYLAAGKPVVSTSIRDVIRPYGDLGLAWIADMPEEFVAACEAALADDAAARQQKADQFLSQISWDKTWGRMSDLIDTVSQDV